MSLTIIASSIATQPAVGPPSVVCRKTAPPLPGTRSLLTPMTTACAYCGMSRFSVPDDGDVLNGHCAFSHTCIRLYVGLFMSPSHQWLGVTWTYCRPPPGFGCVPKAKSRV